MSTNVTDTSAAPADTNASATSQRTILVTGATGQQGRGFVRAVLASSSSAAADIRILALTRNINSKSAQRLAAEVEKDEKTKGRVELVQANLDDAGSVRKVFEGEKSKLGGGIWGVFMVLAFPGLGADASGEVRQGKLVADLCKEFDVQHLVYSSYERAGEDYDDEVEKDHSSKIQVERYIKSLEGLRWTFVRPGFFMENFDGTIGRITATVLQVGLKPDTKLQLIAADDIGPIALAAFLDPRAYVGEAIPVIGDALTTREIADWYRRGAGRPLPGIPRLAARLILATNKHTKALINEFERVARARAELPETPEDLIGRLYPLHPNLKMFGAWARTRGASAERPEGWNNVSLLGLIFGRR